MAKLSFDTIQSLLNDIGELPTLPSIATAIMEKTLEANTTAKQIADLVEKDQALSFKVLKVANSPFYRRIKEISTIRSAVVLLGFNVLKSIVLSISVINLFNKKEKSALDFYSFWQHSIACAVCAKTIASKVIPASCEDAFVAGILHDLGKVIADQIICPAGGYAEVLEAMKSAGRDIVEVEQEAMGIDHPSIGMYLLERWNLPSHLAKAVGYHHSLVDFTDDAQTKRLCSIIHVADMIANHLGIGVYASQTGYIDPALLGQLGLTSQDIQDISLTLKDSISGISDELGIPRAEPKTYFEVLQTANAQLGRLSLDLEQKKMALERRTMELSSLNQMSSDLQSSMKLSDITNTIVHHSLAILDAKKARCLMRLNNLRIMVTEAFMIGGSCQARSGITSATKELLDRTQGVFPRIQGVIMAPLKVDGKIIGALEVILKETAAPDDASQKALLLRTISEVASQAIHRAMLISQHMKAQRLATVTKTAIAANHEINSPLTTILLKLDMLMGERQLGEPARKALVEIKQEVMAIKNVVKRMLEISDVVDTTYARSEKMLDLRTSQGKGAGGQSCPSTRSPQPENAGFEDITSRESRPCSKPSADVRSVSFEHLPGFEDYLEDGKKGPSPQTAQDKAGHARASERPGFEDYLDEHTESDRVNKSEPPKKGSDPFVPGFEDITEK
jgi:HD-like signal output (HDOD) protein